MQRVLHLDDCQIEMARPVWRQASAQLGKLQAQRAEILSQIQLNDTQPLMWHDPARYRASHTVTLLEQVAELTENALLQQEVLRHASRLCAWQVCSPDTLAHAICHAWPAFPDLLMTLKTIADAPLETPAAGSQTPGP